ncbi:MAG: replicative DNA helicase [Acidimicrobiales bacterium]
MDAPPPFPDDDPFGPPPDDPDDPGPGGMYFDEPAPFEGRGRSGRDGRSSGGGAGGGGGRGGGGGSAGRVPPHNIAAEESVLGAMLLSKDAIADVIEIVEAADFYKPGHQHVYEAITALYGAGEPADTVTVAEELGRAGLLGTVGGGGALVALQANTPAATNAGKYARIVHEHALLRRLIRVGSDIAEIGFTQPDDVVKAIDSAESMVFNLAQGRANDTLSPIRELLDANLDRLEYLYEVGDTITGTPTGFIDLDELLAGLQPSNLVVVGARPAMGKTSFALGMVANAALQAQRPVLFFSLEMSQLEISQRLLCAEARVDATRVRNGRLNEDDWTRISHGVGRLAEAPVWIDDNPNTTVMEIRGKARRLKSRIGDLGLVVVDYLQLMTGRSGAESRQVEIAEISRGLKILARELECPVVALSQLSRGLEQRQDKRPMLSDLRESGSIEQDADVVMFLYRDEVYNADSPDMGTAEILVAKHRGGPTGVVRLAFLPHFTRFANMARA